MSILVVNPANKPFTNSSILAEPIDVLQIATIISLKYPEVKVIDMDGCRLENNLNPYLGDDNIVIFVYDYQLPLHTSLAIDNIKEVIENCSCSAKFIMIGKSSSYYCQKFMEIGVDIIIKGVADLRIVPVIDALVNKSSLDTISNLVYRRKGEIVFTSREDSYPSISNLPIPRRDFLDISNYMDTRTMITSRGCIGRCQFCTTPYFFSKWTCKSVEDVIKEIELLVSKYQATKIIFLDDNATVDKKRMLKICEEIQNHNIHCLFGCLASIPTYDKELFLKMYEVGFRWVHFGLESGSERILMKMHKFLPFDITKKIIREVKDMGYRVRTSFILDYPSTDISDIQATRDLILEIEPHEIRFHYLAYRVGTPIFKERGEEECSQYIHSNRSNHCSLEVSSEIQKLIEELKKRGYEIIYDEVDFKKYNNRDKNMKIAAFTPIKYGMCWYE